jgi:hypothetical protein
MTGNQLLFLNEVPANEVCDLASCPPSARQAFLQMPVQERREFISSLSDRIDAGIAKDHLEVQQGWTLVRWVAAFLVAEVLVGIGIYTWLCATGRY